MDKRKRFTARCRFLKIFDFDNRKIFVFCGFSQRGVYVISSWFTIRSCKKYQVISPKNLKWNDVETPKFNLWFRHTLIYHSICLGTKPYIVLFVCKSRLNSQWSSNKDNIISTFLWHFDAFFIPITEVWGSFVKTFAVTQKVTSENPQNVYILDHHQIRKHVRLSDYSPVRLFACPPV